MRFLYFFLLLLLTACAGRVPMALLPRVAVPYHRPAIAQAAPVAVDSAVAAYPAVVEAPRPAPPSRVRNVTAKPVAFQPGRSARRRAVAPTQLHQRTAAPQQNFKLPVWPFVVLGAIVLFLLVSIMLAFTAPATVVGGIGKILLYILGGALLLNLLGSLDERSGRRR